MKLDQFFIKSITNFFYDNLLNNIKKENYFREKLKSKHSNNDTFNKFISEHIISNIPVTFLEGFRQVERGKKVDGPKHQKQFLHHSLLQKTIPSFYTAQKMIIYSKLLHGQHGGAFGQLNYMWHEEHEKKISDKFLNWGWEKNSKSFH